MIRKTGLMIAMAAALSLTACSSQKSENAQLKQQVEQLEQQVTDLQNQTESDSPSGGATDESYAVPQNTSDLSGNAPTDKALPEDTAENRAAADTPAGSAHHEEHAHYDTGSADASALAALIQDLSQRINDAVPTGSDQEQREQFYSLKGEIDLAEKEIDSLEDELEAQRRAGSLNTVSYQTREAELESLEDQLDVCEDQLEYVFGIDD